MSETIQSDLFNKGDDDSSPYNEYDVNLLECDDEFRNHIIQLEIIKKIKNDTINNFSNCMNEAFDAKFYGSKQDFSGLKSSLMPSSWRYDKEKETWFPKKNDPIGRVMSQMIPSLFMFQDFNLHDCLLDILKYHNFKISNKNFSIGYLLHDNFETLTLQIVGQAPEKSWIINK
jgi:hypothetical protein